MKRGMTYLSILIAIVAVVAIFVTFFYHPKCNDPTCWNSKLESCSKASYVNKPIDVTWEYTIKGKSGDSCVVEVKVVDIKRGLKKAEILEDKSMICELPLGSTTAPEANPNLCTGVLKEAMQVLIIEKLHEYIIQNIGDIKDQIGEIEGVTIETEENEIP